VQVKELQLEMEEMHDQFRDEETTEIRELQREKIQADEKSRQLEARFKTSDDRQHLLELEEELRMAKVGAT